MPMIAKPFQRIAIDLVGPLPQTQRGNRYILTMCDYATRYSGAIPLSSTEVSRIAKELVGIFARMGIPEEILTDQGTNFMSTMLEEIYQLLQITRIRTPIAKCHRRLQGFHPLSYFSVGKCGALWMS